MSAAPSFRPAPGSKSAPRDELLVVLDVDGVTRRGVTDSADPAVIRAVKELLDHSVEAKVHAEVAFLSGTPSFLQAADLPDWCGGNVPLSFVFGDSFNAEIAAGRVSIHGQLGADKLVLNKACEDGREALVGVVEQGFTHTQQAEIFVALIEAYLVDLERTSREAHMRIAPSAADAMVAVKEAAKALEKAAAAGIAPKLCTRAPPELEPFAAAVREHFDPHFRVVSNGATVEYHDFKTLGKFHHEDLVVPGHASSGIAHRDGNSFRFVIVTTTNKGETVKRLVERRRAETARRRGGNPEDHELEVVTVGDTAIDYPMHELASTPFHVGIPAVWDAHDRAEVAHVACVTRRDGSAPLVDGTVAVLEAISHAMRSGGGGLDIKRVNAMLGDNMRVRETLVD